MGPKFRDTQKDRERERERDGLGREPCDGRCIDAVKAVMLFVSSVGASATLGESQLFCRNEITCQRSISAAAVTAAAAAADDMI